MILCDTCSGKGVIEEFSSFGGLYPCSRCRGSGRLQLSDLRQGDHCFHVYTHTREQIDTITSFLIEGLKRQEKCLCIIDSLKINRVQKAFQETGIDTDREYDAGRLIILPASDFYLPGGKFEPEKIQLSFDQNIQDTIRDGFSGLRAVGEFPSIASELVVPEKIIYYEALIHDYMKNSQPLLTGLCQYYKNGISQETARWIEHSHNLTLTT